MLRWCFGVWGVSCIVCLEIEFVVRVGFLFFY